MGWVFSGGGVVEGKLFSFVPTARLVCGTAC